MKQDSFLQSCINDSATIFQQAWIFGSTCFCEMGITQENLTLYLLYCKGSFSGNKRWFPVIRILYILIKILRVGKVKSGVHIVMSNHCKGVLPLQWLLIQIFMPAVIIFTTPFLCKKMGHAFVSSSKLFAKKGPTISHRRQYNPKYMNQPSPELKKADFKRNFAFTRTIIQNLYRGNRIFYPSVDLLFISRE